MSLSFEEKSAWVQLLGMGLCIGGYFVVASRMYEGGTESISDYVPMFAVSVGLLILIQIVGHIVAVVTGTPEERDERDRSIRWKAQAKSGWILGGGSILAVWTLVSGLEVFWTAHILLGSLFVAHLVTNALQILYYRLGMSS